MRQKVQFHLCECMSPHHSFYLIFFPEDGLNEKDLYLTAHLATGGLWNRLKRAVLYIFKKTTPWGEWDEIILSPESARDLYNFIGEFLKDGNHIS